MKPGIKNIIITIPKWTQASFEKELYDSFPTLNFQFIQLDPEVKTWKALREILKLPFTDKNLIISNWDIFYGDLKLKEYYDYHKTQKSDFSFCLKFVFNPEQLGNVRIHWNKIIEFVERPKASQMNLTNSGLYITTRNFLDIYNFWDYLEMDFFPKLPDLWNTIWYIYSWEWEHIQNDSAYERVNGWLM
jgi:NDP-sugar pyrophosphorylase family protein